MAVQTTLDYLRFIEDIKQMYRIGSDDELAQLLYDGNKLELKTDDEVKRHELDRSVNFFVEDLECNRLRWAVEYIMDEGYRGRVPMEKMGVLTDRLQVGYDYIDNIVIPVLSHLDLIKTDENNVYATEKLFRGIIRQDAKKVIKSSARRRSLLRLRP